ncbi:MAG: nitrogenase component 1 [Candidatus Limivivens sp.]|nr:nitrogenase component 1 [Candidatus Limivivens sp.]
MYSIFYDELTARLYPSTLLHAYGVNGKISGSVGAIGEIGGRVAAVLHAPVGCAYHYRYSARRRHQPFYPLLSTDLTEQEIIFGGEEKLLRTVREAWERYQPEMIFIIPSPVSDILNEDIRSAAEQLRREGIPVTAIQSELFSHRDKNYSRNRLREVAKQKISGDNRLEIELKGCGFTEALYAMVEQVMKPQTVVPCSVNIETVGWGGEGRAVLREMEAFLNACGITVNTWIPSAGIRALECAPKAQLNLVKRIRWAKRMKEKFGTDYLQLNGNGRYVGLAGISRLYQDIAEKLGILPDVQERIREQEETVREMAAESLEYLVTRQCVLVCRGLADAPFTLKLYAKEFGVRIRAVCLLLTSEQRRSLNITRELEEQLMGRVREAAALYAPEAEILFNPTRESMGRVFADADAVLGTGDFTLEGIGAPVIPAGTETTSLSFESWLRNVRRLESRIRNGKSRDHLLLNRLPFQEERFTDYENRSSRAAREMWQRMWLERKEEET